MLTSRAVLLGLLLAAVHAARASQCPTPLAVVQGAGAETFAELLSLYASAEAAADAPSPAAAEPPVVAGANRKLLQAVACPLIYAPVCGVDNITYGNDCAARAANVAIAYEGECGSQSPSAGTPQKPCNRNIAPVCGSDGRSYNNACLAENAGVTIVSQGYCGFVPLPSVRDDTSAGDSSSAGDSDAATDSAPAAGLPNPVACPAIYAPVCGVSDETHGNDCVALAAGDTVACQGECPCPDLLAALESEGGILFVPAEDSLLPLLANFTSDAGEDWTQSPSLVRALVAAHVALGQGRAAPAVPTVVTTVEGDGVVSGTLAPAPAAGAAQTLAEGVTITTEGGVRVEPSLVSGADGAEDWFLLVEGLAPVPVLGIRSACTFDVVLLGEPLVAERSA